MKTIASPESDAASTWVQHVVEKVKSLRFGNVQIKIHDGQVVVVEATELTRFHIPHKNNNSKGSSKTTHTPSSTP